MSEVRSMRGRKCVTENWRAIPEAIDRTDSGTYVRWYFTSHQERGDPDL